MRLVIPLGHTSDLKDWELRMMLRSFETNYDGEFDVTILGEYKPTWIKGVDFIHCERKYPKRILEKYNGHRFYEQFFDVLYKLKRAAEEYSEFLWIYDDVVLIKKSNYKSLRKLYAYKNGKNGYSKRKGNRWGRTINKTIEILVNKGKTDYVYETHIPRLFHSGLTEVFEEFLFEIPIPYAPSTLYFNYYEFTPNIITNDNPKAGFYGGETDFDNFSAASMDDINNAVRGKTWINYNDDGLTKHLMQYIGDKFPKESRFEK